MDKRADQSRSGVHAMRFTLAGGRALDEAAAIRRRSPRRAISALMFAGQNVRRLLRQQRLRRWLWRVRLFSHGTWDFSHFSIYVTTDSQIEV
jgi:hypothetical protein